MLSWDGAYNLAVRFAIQEQDGDMQRVYAEIAMAIKARSKDARDCMDMMYRNRQRQLQRFH